MLVKNRYNIALLFPAIFLKAGFSILYRTVFTRNKFYTNYVKIQIKYRKTPPSADKILN